MKPKQKSDGLAPRRAALHIIKDVKAGEQLGDAYLKHLPHVLERDRALTRHLAVTTLKREGQLKALIKRCLTRPMPKNARPVLDILALGVAQLFFAQVPKHAAVSTTVDLVAKDKRPAIRALKPLANAIMRRLSGEDGAKWLEKQDAVKLNTPKWVWDRWTKFYGEDKARAIINA
ncbi:MAG: transcription antitermination factor NusB, partial [Sphingomonadales bacterium]